MLRTGAWNLRNWERGRHGIEIRFFPAIIQFLGYHPWPTPRTRDEAVYRERMARGWSRRRLAELAGVDEATIRRLERDTPRMARRPLKSVTVD
jgi:hypothetical protein